MADLEKFRSDARSWLEASAPKSLFGARGDALEGVWGGRKAVYANPDRKRWLEIMAEKGWTAPGWPAEYGGGALSPEQAKILAEEMRRLRLPAPLVGFGLTMIGPTLLQFGAEEQKREHLPRICRGEIRWCQGYSEPGAGSDLAALQCKAEEDGDHFLVTGTKVWTSTPICPTDLRPGPHRSKAEAGGHHLPPGRHGEPRVTVRPIQRSAALRSATA
jgi:acyl-CoA dehydrogenase